MTSKKKIILAEDNLADVELTKIAFEEVGIPFDLVHVPDGQELINHVNQCDLSEIALVLLDLNMPRVGGIDVLKHFYEDDNLKKIPVIVLSSSKHDVDIKTCYDYGANAYVCKPIDLNDFSVTINSIAQFWGLINIRPSFD